MLNDLKDREKERVRTEDDYLDELRIYDLTIVADFWKKYCRKMLGLLVNKPASTSTKSSGDNYDEKLIESRIPSCFHVNYIMNESNPVRPFQFNP